MIHVSIFCTCLENASCYSLIYYSMSVHHVLWHRKKNDPRSPPMCAVSASQCQAVIPYVTAEKTGPRMGLVRVRGCLRYVSRPSWIPRSENENSALRKCKFYAKKSKFCTQKIQICTQKLLQWCSKQTTLEFCAQKMEILHSRNRNSVLQNGNSVLRKWKISPMPCKVCFSLIFLIKMGEILHWRAEV